jgi:hypothetical protein
MANVLGKKPFDKRQQHIEDYAAWVRDNHRLPSGNDLKDEFGLTKKTVEHHFGNYERLRRAAQKEFPQSFDGVFLPEDFSDQKFEELSKDAQKYRRFVVTTAVTGQKLFKPGYDAIQNYCKKRKAKLLILPLGKDLTQLDSALKRSGIVTKTLHLNSNIKLTPIRLSEKTVRPTAGLSRLGQRSCSTIYPAPKLTKESIATDLNKLPHLVLTPGAITEASYSEKSGTKMVKKTDYIAEADHDMACVVIEIYDDKFFFEREMQIDIDGSVVDLTPNGAFRYHASGKVTPEVALNFNLGDWHSGETSQNCWEAWPELAQISKAKTISLHDFQSYEGPSHHTTHDRILSAQMEEQGKTDLVSEFEGAALDLKMWLSKTKAQLYVVASNHPEHLDRAVKEGRLDQPSTYRCYLELALAMMQGYNPLQWGLKNYANFFSKRVVFLSREDRHVLKNRLGQAMALHYHGDKGSNGSKGPQSLGVALGCSIVGHTHTPKIEASNGGMGMWTNGTSTCINGADVPQYAKGSASSWLQTSTLTFCQPNGRFLRTQITLVGGSCWTIDSKKKPKTLEEQPDIRAKVHTIRHHKNAIKRVRGLNTKVGPIIKV